MQKVIVVLPTYNEAENLPHMLPTLLDLPVEGLEVLVVDDNSPDGSGEIAEAFAREAAGRIQVLHRPGKEGLGVAYKEGLRAALTQGADLIIQMDCDFSHPPEKLPEMVAQAATHDLVIGSRYVAGGSTSEEWGLWRKLLSLWANRIYIGLILHTRTRDATAGFRVWRRAALQSIDLDLIR
ncbi:MAG: glycosyltransferase, partial [Anaerolineae bacterium]|nr:glycosyltransferase [Anaerolineae bacterium]